MSESLPFAARRTAPGTRWTGNRWPLGDEVVFLTPGEWARTAGLMLLEDSKLRQFSAARTDPILQARYEVVPGAGPRALEFAEFVARAFGIGEPAAPRVCAKGWSDIIELLARGLDVGFALVEPLWGVGPDGKWWPVDVADVDAASVSAFIRGKDYQLGYVEQNLARTGIATYRHVVPADSVLLFTAGRVGDNYAGVGALRPCYPWWMLKRDIPALCGQAMMRHAIPPVVLTTSRAVMEGPLTGNGEGYAPEDVEAIFTEAERAGIQMQSGESTLLKAFGQNGGGLGWSLLGGGQAYNPANFDQTATMCDRAMAAAFRASVVEMGTKGEGSRAIGEVHLDQLKASLGNQLDSILKVFHGPARPAGGLFARMLGYNWPDVRTEELPQVLHRGLEVDGLADALGAVPSLIAAGVLDATELRSRIGQLLGVELTSGTRSESPAVDLTGVPQVGGGGRPEGT